MVHWCPLPSQPFTQQELSSNTVSESHRVPELIGPLQVLGDALAAAEGVGGEAHPRVACVLLELGRLYARTARVGLAEGLYRCRWLCPLGIPCLPEIT